jgi:ketosteroid isomerase-like protein
MSVVPTEHFMNKLSVFAFFLLVAVALSGFAQSSSGDEAGRVLGLENAWNHAIEAKDTKALNQLLAPTFVAVDIDGSLTNKSEFLGGIKAPSDQPSQAVYEQIRAEMYGTTAVTTGIFRIREIQKGKPVVLRERFIDTKSGQTWQCVASQVTLIPSK